MRYKIKDKTINSDDIIETIHTEDGEMIKIVKRDNYYKLRRMTDKNNHFVWDLSKTHYSTPKEAETALLSGNVVFELGK